jgi:hypothetical protein
MHAVGPEIARLLRERKTVAELRVKRRCSLQALAELGENTLIIFIDSFGELTV